MKLKKVLEKLDELLREWGLISNDWFLSGEYAWKLQGYDFVLRKGHLDIFVNRDKWPWKTEPEDISCLPLESKSFDRLKKFIEETKFAPHFLPCPIKLKYHPIEELKSNSFIYVLPNKKKIRVYGIQAEFEDRARTLLKEDLSTWKKETIVRWLKCFTEIGKIAKKKNDKKMIKICGTALKRLEKVKKEFKPIKEKIPKEISTIKGISAFGGKVKGKVQVILNAKEISRFKKGNILVTSMTSPEFIPIIEKAKAIVTDEGGIGCHAAIISREFKIPCIIGTKIATKVLSEGDAVLVEAKTGIVKKLK